MLRPVSRDTLTRQAAITLKRFIITENLPAGSQLPSERELSEILAVSRNIVREALSQLVAEGIVSKRAGKGTFVAKFDRSAVLDHLPLTVGSGEPSAQALREARAALEIGAIGLMVQRITDDEIVALKLLLDTYEQKHAEGKSTIKEDIEFHTALLRATKNSVIEDLTPMIADVFRRTLSEDASAIRRKPGANYGRTPAYCAGATRPRHSRCPPCHA